MAVMDAANAFFRKYYFQRIARAAGSHCISYRLQQSSAFRTAAIQMSPLRLKIVLDYGASFDDRNSFELKFRKCHLSTNNPALESL